MITILFVFKSCLEFFRKDRRNKGLDIFVFLLSAAGIFGIGKLISMTTRKKVNRSDIY